MDALEPMHDQLKANVLWWLLEIIPLSYEWQDKDGEWHTAWRYVPLPGFRYHEGCLLMASSINMGRGRKIYDQQPVFHSSVKQRMESALKYTPQARWKEGSERYIS